jgi:hypothetical protein
VSRARIAVALLLAAAGGGAVLAATTADASSGKHFRYTHRVALTGRLVDHWTFNDPAECGRFGDGTVTVTFRMTTAPKVRLVIEPGKNAEPNNTLGSWILGVPTGGGIGDLRSQPASGTVTLVDNTSLRPPSPGGDCGVQDKSDCGTKTIPRWETKIAGYNRHQLYADLLGGWSHKSNGRPIACGIGQVEMFSMGRLTGGSRAGELLLPMASTKTVAHHRVVRVTGTGHKHSSFPDCGSGTSCSDDVTRSVTVTFKRL